MSALAEIVTEMLAERKPRLIVIDSFKALNELIETPHERRTILFDLASVLTAYKCTTFLVGEYSGEMMTDLPEFAIADSILLLLKHATGVREQRFLRVEKLRGSGSVPGMHAFNISEQRNHSVSPAAHARQFLPTYASKPERVNTGVAGLDEMIEKGFWRGSTTLVAGPTGSGKTIIGLSFHSRGRAQRRAGRVCWVSRRTRSQLSRVMSHFDWDPESVAQE